VNESYILSIPANCTIATITAESSYGVLWALQSFNQLFYTHTDGKLYTNHAPVHIQDEPKFKHRGLNLDLSRHFYGKEIILRIIEALSWQKFNRFHMHITDSQSWYHSPLYTKSGLWRSPLFPNWRKRVRTERDYGTQPQTSKIFSSSHLNAEYKYTSKSICRATQIPYPIRIQNSSQRATCSRTGQRTLHNRQVAN